MKRYFTRSAFLSDGWHENVTLTIGDSGIIDDITICQNYSVDLGQDILELIDELLVEMGA